MSSPRCLALTALLILGTAAAHAQSQWQALPEQAPEPKDNPATPAKIELGRMLFFDPRFSETGAISCFSCHNVMEGGDDHRPTSIGVHGMKGARNAPTVFNAAFQSVQFWDGRAASLEEQAKGPVVNPVEMGMQNLEAAIERIRRIPGYRPYFERAFGAGDGVTIDNAARAIAAYERTLVTPNSAYDRFVQGDAGALTEQQQRGMRTFEEVGCLSCHQGPAFSGPSLPQGTGFFMKFPLNYESPYVSRYELLADAGRYETTGRDEDRDVWRVPTLRNLTYTAPYMHNGSVKSLAEAVRVMAHTELNRTLSDTEVEDIVALLDGLTGEFPVDTMPRLPPTPGDLLE